MNTNLEIKIKSILDLGFSPTNLNHFLQKEIPGFSVDIKSILNIFSIDTHKINKTISEMYPFWLSSKMNTRHRKKASEY